MAALFAEKNGMLKWKHSVTPWSVL